MRHKLKDEKMDSKYAKNIVTAVNERLQTAFSFERTLNTVADAILCNTNDGKTFVIVGYFIDNQRYFVRSVIKALRGGKAAWLSNGQATKGKQVAYWAEGEFTLSIQNYGH